MESSIVRFTLRFSLRQQITLVLIALAAQPFYIYSLQIPKDIINRVIEDGQAFPQDYRVLGLGLPQLDRIDLLIVLCSMFLLMVLFTGGLKYYTNVYAGVVGERMLRRLRYDLIDRALRFPPAQHKKVSPGEIVSMVTLETEPLGGFVADMCKVPALQGGLLLSALGFILYQDWKMGVAATALFPIQIYLIPKLQRQVNQLGKQRIQAVRRLSERIGEVVSATGDIHANDMSRRVLADFSGRLGSIYWIRLNIYRKKFFIKFLNNFLAQLTPFLFFAIGGYMVIQGDLSSGALVAALVAYKDLSPPIKELLAFYQRKEDARIKYEQLLQQFQPDGMLAAELAAAEPPTLPRLAGPVIGANASYADTDGVRAVEGASFVIDPETRVLLIGPGGSGKDELARLIARQMQPTGGRITVDDHDLSRLPIAATGRRIGYVGPESTLFQGTLMDNLLAGVMNRMRAKPAIDDPAQRADQDRLTHEARESGNSPDDLRGDWIDHAGLGLDAPGALTGAVRTVLHTVDLEADLYALGLLRTIDPTQRPDLADRLLEARRRLRQRLQDPGFAPFVEPFDIERYNTNASVGENILYGTPVGDTFSETNLARHPHMRSILADHDLIDDFLVIGRKAAETMVELFSDLPPGHRFFERYGFIEHDDLETFQHILRRLEHGSPDRLAAEDYDRLLDLPFRLIPSRHRLGLIEETMQERLLRVRGAFSHRLPEDLWDKVDFYDIALYNAAAPIEVNILFGRVAYGRAGAAERVRAVIADILDDLELRSDIVDLALQAEAGVSGNRLAPPQKQKLVLGRALMKQPDLIVVNEALSALDRDRQAAIREAIAINHPDATLVWVDSQQPETADHHKLMVMRDGKIDRIDDLVPFTSLGDAGSAPDAADTPDPARSLRVLSDDELADLPEAERDIHRLRRIPMFAALDWSNLRLLASTCEKLTYDAGELLFRQGDEGDAMYVVTAGTGAVFVSEGEQENVIREIGANEVIGEVALLTDAPRSASIRAVSELQVIRMSRTTFVELVKDHSEISFQLIRELAMRLFDTTRRFETLMNEHRRTVGW